MIESLHGRDGLALGLLIDRLGSYLALATVGIALAACYAADARPSALAMARKVAAFPPFVAIVIALALRPVAPPGGVETSRVTVIEAAMPPMIGAAIVAQQAKLDARLATLTIGIGIPLGLATALAWHCLFWRAGLKLQPRYRIVSAVAAAGVVCYGAPP